MDETAHLFVDSDGYPLLEGSSTILPESKTCYRTLGKLFSLCCTGFSDIKTGLLFPLEVYECITTTNGPSVSERAKWHLFNYLSLKRTYPLFKFLTQPGADKPCSEDIYVQSILEAIGYEVSDLNDNNKKAAICETLLFEASKDPRLQALYEITLTLNRNLTPSYWINLRRCAKTLKTVIEGELTNEKVISHLDWNPEGQISDEKYQRTQGYLINWLKNVNQEIVINICVLCIGIKNIKFTKIKNKCL